MFDLAYKSMITSEIVFTSMQLKMKEPMQGDCDLFQAFMKLCVQDTNEKSTLPPKTTTALNCKSFKQLSRNMRKVGKQEGQRTFKRY